VETLGKMSGRERLGEKEFWQNPKSTMVKKSARRTRQAHFLSNDFGACHNFYLLWL
jgi:hypothetical protein